jgi:hypothetical protein
MSAPHYDPELTTEGYFDRLYVYYGFAPFWMPGYSYPIFAVPI